MNSAQPAKIAAILLGTGAAAVAVAGSVWAGYGLRGTGKVQASAKMSAMSGAGKDAAPVVVELFTSEGCSSCPSADAVISKLEKSDAPIIVLGQHVDYWNRLGWADPFSSKAFTDRQNQYAVAFKNESVYTPQVVVDGQAEFVGSEKARAESEIALASRRPKAPVSLVLQPGAKAGAFDFQTTIGALPNGVRNGEVFAAYTESGLSSQVRAGENAGRRLSHASVVRTLVSLGVVGAKGGTLSKNISLPSGVRKNNAHAVVFVQDTQTRHIVGAAQSAL